jgi:ATPase subunit of ABC transporter with duplicated ATPase domains
MLLVSHDERFLARLARKRWSLAETAPDRVELRISHDFP